MFYAINLRKFYKIFSIIFILGLIIALFIALVYIFPLKHLASIEKYSKKYNVDKELICAVINIESNFKKGAVSPKGASGLMQLMSPTAKWMAEKNKIENFDFSKDIFNPDTNIEIGTAYLRHLLNQYGQKEELALASYNAGMGNVYKWLNDERYSKDGEKLTYIPFKETRDYVKKVIICKKVYRHIFNILDFLGDIFY